MAGSKNNSFAGNPKTNVNLLLKALDASVSGIILTDNSLPDNPIIYCNKAFEDITGYQADEIIGHNCRFLQAADKNQPQRSTLRNAVKNGEDCVVEIRNYRKDGTLFWNELYMSPVRDNEGNVIYFIGVQHDITKRKKVESELLHQQEIMVQKVNDRTRNLKESEDFLNSIVQTVREGLIVLNPKFKVISVNDFFLRTFKVTRQETEGQDLFELGNGQWNIPALRQLLENILPTNNPVEEFEVEHDFPHIGRKIMLLNAHRIELEGQYKDQILIAIEDISEERSIERRKDDFLSIASHELRTPLTSIIGYLQLMQKLMPADTDPALAGIVNKTSKYTFRLNNLITELLDVSKIQSGKIELHKHPFDFDKTVGDVIENISVSSTNHKIILKGKTGIEYNGDESHIVQVISNLLSNAIKYSPAETTVEVYLSVVGDFLKVSVTDQGMGISLDERKKIFERFYRVGEIQQRFPGMGIGLYICDQIIKNHQGTLWVESEKGRGSTFNFTLPIQTATDDK